MALERYIGFYGSYTEHKVLRQASSAPDTQAGYRFIPSSVRSLVSINQIGGAVRPLIMGMYAYQHGAVRGSAA